MLDFFKFISSWGLWLFVQSSDPPHSSTWPCPSNSAWCSTEGQKTQPAGEGPSHYFMLHLGYGSKNNHWPKEIEQKHLGFPYGRCVTVSNSVSLFDSKQKHNKVRRASVPLRPIFCATHHQSLQSLLLPRSNLHGRSHGSQSSCKPAAGLQTKWHAMAIQKNERILVTCYPGIHAFFMWKQPLFNAIYKLGSKN